MARKPTPPAAVIDVAANEVVLQQDITAANQLAALTREADTRVRAVATTLGYQLPANATHPDLIQRDIAANMRRSVEACLEVGKALCVLKEACGHGNFIERLDDLGIEIRVAQKFMASATKFSNAASTPLLKAVGNQTKLFEMLVLDDEQIEELALTGQTGELALDDVATMSVKELRAKLREERAERAADAELMGKKQARIDRLERETQRIRRLPAPEQMAQLKKEATDCMRDTLASLRGQLRQALLALRDCDPLDPSPSRAVFMAGLVGAVQADLAALRDEFNLPDVSSAADAALAAEVAQWAN